MISFRDEELVHQIERHEGRKSRLYQCSLGKWTIGVGRNVEDRGLSNDEIDLMRDNDIKTAIAEVDLYFPWAWKMTETRQRVIVEMCFQMGIRRLRGFKKALLAMASGFFDTAADEMLDSNWAHQTPERASFLSAQMRLGK